MTRVLIADDSRPLRNLMREMLGDDCEVVAEAADGDEAITLFERERPDAVVIDVRMPGVDGIEATEVIKRREPETTVVVCTGAGGNEVERASAAGADGHVIKPFGKPQLVEAVCRAA